MGKNSSWKSEKEEEQGTRLQVFSMRYQIVAGRQKENSAERAEKKGGDSMGAWEMDCTSADGVG